MNFFPTSNQSSYLGDAPPPYDVVAIVTTTNMPSSALLPQLTAFTVPPPSLVSLPTYSETDPVAPPPKYDEIVSNQGPQNQQVVITDIGEHVVIVDDNLLSLSNGNDDSQRLLSQHGNQGSDRDEGCHADNNYNDNNGCVNRGDETVENNTPERLLLTRDTRRNVEQNKDDVTVVNVEQENEEEVLLSPCLTHVDDSVEFVGDVGVHVERPLLMERESGSNNNNADHPEHELCRSDK